MIVKKRNKISNYIFIALFLILLLIPAAGFDSAQIIDSKTENRRMTTWPGFYPDGSKNTVYEYYVQDRVAFREPVVALYGNVIYHVFGEFTENLHMYGKDGEIFPANKEYIAAYQHLATDEELIDDLAGWLSRTKVYLDGQGIPFVFMMGLDKKTVCSNAMPDSIRVDGSRDSIPQYLSKRLDEESVPYVIPVEAFRSAMREGRIYNRIYDTAHWNADGAYLGMQLLNDRIRQLETDAGREDILPAMKKSWFKVKTKEYPLENSFLDIREEVPIHKLKKKFKNALTQEESLLEQVPYMEGVYLQHFISEKAKSNQTLLIFGDSFIRERTDYLMPQYHDIYSVGRQNYKYLQTYVETWQPDVVVFEVAERAFVDDLYNYTELSGIVYP